MAQVLPQSVDGVRLLQASRSLLGRLAKESDPKVRAALDQFEKEVKKSTSVKSQ